MTAAEMFCERVLDGITNWDKPKARQDEENVAKSKGPGEKKKVEKLADGGNAETAIDAALAYLEREGDEPTRRNVFAKDWALKKPDGKGKTSKTAQDELYEALVEDAETLTDKTLAEHDKERHPHGYHEGDTCKFREKMMVETEADKADEVDADKVGRETTGTSEQHGQIENKGEGVSVDKPQARIYEGLSKKKVEKYKGQMAKKHPELDADLILTELAKIKDPKLQGDAFAWVMKGAIKLPEDMYKVERARELATKAKRDPLQWDTPQACIDELRGEGHRVKEKPITVEELKKNPLMSDYRDEGYGVETFQVDDSRDGQNLMRQVINTHWGKDANPWCLLHGDENGNLSDGSDGGYDAWKYWQHYNALPKRVAFKNGKLLAFMAAEKKDLATDELREIGTPSKEDLPTEYSEYEKEYGEWNPGNVTFQQFLEWNHYDAYDGWGQRHLPEEWWDRKDELHYGIPMGVFESKKDKYHRKIHHSLKNGELIEDGRFEPIKTTYGVIGINDGGANVDNISFTPSNAPYTYVFSIRKEDGRVLSVYSGKHGRVLSLGDDGFDNLVKQFGNGIETAYEKFRAMEEEIKVETGENNKQHQKKRNNMFFSAPRESLVADSKDEITSALLGENYVEDADTLPQGETLEEHDRKKHKGHFDPSTQTCKFRDEMKKETDADRADEISPESAPKAKGEEEGGQKKPLVSPEEDKAYMEAVERGDMETAAKMVREVAERNGFGTFGLHGTKEEFTVFDKKRIGSSNDEGWLGRGFYFWDGSNRVYAGQYANGGKVMEVMLSMQEPYFIEEDEMNRLIDAADRHDVETLEEFTQDIKNNGYDSVMDNNGQMMVFEPSQIKSAAPVTYDDKGNVIPLSRRFDDGDDIRGDVSIGGDDKPSSVEKEESRDLESYEKNFTEDGEWKSPWNNGGPTFDTRKSVGVARNPWTKASRAEAEMAAQMLKRVLGGVTVGFSDKPYEGEGDTRKSIGGIFTGSAADYDKPSLLKIGTGEGNQVYGWGLYGSNQRGVAEGYASMAAGNKSGIGYIKNGREIPYYGNSVESKVAGALGLWGDVETAIEEMKGVPQSEEIIKELREHGQEYKEYRPEEIVYEQTFFTNREPGDESHLIEWYEPISSENKLRVAKGLAQRWMKRMKGLGKDSSGKEQKYIDNYYEHLGGDKKSITGEKLYNFLSERLESPKAASELLANSDIDGIKYPVDSYGADKIKDGDKVGWNYVSFRDDNIRIDHKWVDGQQRYFRNQKGEVVGEYDRNTNKITLYPGATVRDVVHEYSHGLWQFAEQEAEAGRGELLDKMKSIADTAPEEVKSAVAANYEEVTPDVYLEECFTHEMARRSDTAFAKAIGSKEGKPWYKRAWGAIKDAWKGLATKIGLNKADISKIGKMSDGDAAEHILSQMMEGRRFGEVKGKGADESRRSVTNGEGEKNRPLPANLKFIDEVELPSEEDINAFAIHIKNIRERMDERIKARKTIDSKRQMEQYNSLSDKICEDGVLQAREALSLLGFCEDDDIIREGQVKVKNNLRNGLSDNTLKGLSFVLSKIPLLEAGGELFAWDTDKTRASGNAQGITMNRGNKFMSYIHESGHWIESNNEIVHNLCAEFLRYRTEGEKFIHVGPDVNKTVEKGKWRGRLRNEVPIRSEMLVSKDWEIGKKDRFSSPYSGKFYYKEVAIEESKEERTKRFQEHLKARKSPDSFKTRLTRLELYATEILSVGMQELLQNPDKFIKSDSQYARFVLGVLMRKGPLQPTRKVVK